MSGYYKMLRASLDRAIATEQNPELKEIMQSIDEDIMNMEFVSVDQIYEHGYKLIDFIQDEVCLERERINGLPKKEKDAAEKQFEELGKVWTEVSNMIPEITKVFNMSEKELSAMLKNQLTKDKLDTINIRESQSE